MIKFKQKGNLQQLDNFFKKSIDITKVKNVIPIIEECIQKLKDVTPKDSGITASSWQYEIKNSRNKKQIIISNTNTVDGINVAFVIDVGHATSSGSWVQGKNYIRPVVIESYNKILNNTWKELKRL